MKKLITFIIILAFATQATGLGNSTSIHHRQFAISQLRPMAAMLSVPQPIKRRSENPPSGGVDHGFAEYVKSHDLSKRFTSLGVSETMLESLIWCFSNPDNDARYAYNLQMNLISNPAAMEMLLKNLKELDFIVISVFTHQKHENSQEVYDLRTAMYKNILMPETGRLPRLLANLSSTLKNLNHPEITQVQRAIAETICRYNEFFTRTDKIFESWRFQRSYAGRIYSDAPHLSAEQAEFLVKTLLKSLSRLAGSAVLAKLRQGYNPPDGFILAPDMAKPTRASSAGDETDNIWRLNCGGTIDMAGIKSRKGGGALERKLKQLGLDGEIFARDESVFERNPDSSNIGPEEWSNYIVPSLWKMVREIEQLPQGERPAGIVITYGTDTISEIALLLSLEFAGKLPVPVIMIGAHSPSEEEVSDAVDNVLFANRLLRSGKVPNLIYVVSGNKAYMASTVLKTGYPRLSKDGKETYNEEYLKSYHTRDNEATPIILTEDDEIYVQDWLKHWYSLYIQREPLSLDVAGEFGVVEHIRVDCHTPLLVFEDAQKRLKKLARQGKRCGIIIQGYIGNNKNIVEIENIVDDLMENGIYVAFLSTRFYKMLQYRGRKGEAVPLPMPPDKARLKLSWLLSRDVSFAELRPLMKMDFMGEVNIDQTKLPGFVRHEGFPVNEYLRKGQEIIVAYPGIDAEVFTDSVNRLRSSMTPVKRLIVYAFGDGNLPTGNFTIEEAVKKYIGHHFIYGRYLESLLEGLLAERGANGTADYTHVESVLNHIIENELGGNALRLLFERYSVKTNMAISGAIIRGVLSKADIHETDQDILFAKQKEAIKAALKEGFDFIEEKIDEGRWVNLKSINDMKKYLDKLLEHSDIVAIVQKEPWVLSRTIMREALAYSNPILMALKEAVDNNITVEIKSRAVYTDADISLYELGNMLLVIGCCCKGMKQSEVWYPLLEKIEPARASSAGADEARAMAKHFEGIDMLRIFSSSLSDEQNRVRLKLSNFPVQELLSDIAMLDRDSRDYRLSTIALTFNCNLLSYRKIRETYFKLKDQPEKRKDIAYILRCIQHHNPVFLKQAGGGKFDLINRRTWETRAQHTIPVIEDAYESFRRLHPEDTFIVGDFAVSDGTSALELAENLADRDVKIIASDRMTYIWYMKHRVQRKVYLLFFTPQGDIIQIIDPDSNMIGFSDGMDKGFREELEEIFTDEISRYDVDADCLLRKISLINPEAEEFANEHSDRLEFREQDVFEPMDYHFHFIRVLGLLMRGEFSYFTDNRIRTALALLGSCLFDGGFLLNGTCWGGHGEWDLFVRKQNMLHRDSANSQGFFKDRNTPDWQQIPIRASSAGKKDMPIDKQSFLLEALSRPSNGEIIDLTGTLPEDYKRPLELDIEDLQDPAVLTVTKENLKWLLDKAKSRETIVVLGAGSADYNILASYSDIKRVVLVDLQPKSLEAAYCKFPENFVDKVYLVRADILGPSEKFFNTLIPLLKDETKEPSIEKRTANIKKCLGTLLKPGSDMREDIIPDAFADIVICDKIYTQASIYLACLLRSTLSSYYNLTKAEEQGFFRDIAIAILEIAKKLQIRNWQRLLKKGGCLYVAYTPEQVSPEHIQHVAANDPIHRLSEMGSFKLLNGQPHRTYMYHNANSSRKDGEPVSMRVETACFIRKDATRRASSAGKNTDTYLMSEALSATDALSLLGAAELKKLPDYLKIGVLERDEQVFQSIRESGTLPREVRDLLDNPHLAEWNKTLTPKVITMVNAFFRNAHKDDSRLEVLDGVTIENSYQENLFGGLANLFTWACWNHCGLSPEKGLGKRLSKVYPSYQEIYVKGPGKVAYKEEGSHGEQFLEQLKRNREIRNACLTLARYYMDIGREDWLYRANFEVELSGMGDQHEEWSTPLGLLYFSGALNNLCEAGYFDSSLIEEFNKKLEKVSFSYYEILQILPFRLKKALSQGASLDINEIVDNLFDCIKHHSFQKKWTQWHVDQVYLTLSAAKSQGILIADEIWKAIKSRLSLLETPRPRDSGQAILSTKTDRIRKTLTELDAAA